MAGSGYQDDSNLPDDIVRAGGSVARQKGFGPPAPSACSPHARPRTAGGRTRPDPPARPDPIVLVTGDMFVRPKWAYWLRDTIPGATEVVEIKGARLFFPDERQPNVLRRCAAIGPPTPDIRSGFQWSSRPERARVIRGIC